MSRTLRKPFPQGQVFRQKFPFPQGFEESFYLLQRESYLSLARGTVVLPLMTVVPINFSVLTPPFRSPTPAHKLPFSPSHLIFCAIMQYKRYSLFSIKWQPFWFTLSCCQFPSLADSTFPAWVLNPAGAGLKQKTSVFLLSSACKLQV